MMINVRLTSRKSSTWQPSTSDAVT